MAVNTMGYVSPLDGGNPRIVGGIAYETVSGGQLVYASGAADNVSSGVNSLASTDIGIATGASGAKFNGVAIQTVTSGNYVGVATRGLVIVRAGGTIVNGQVIAANGADDVVPFASISGADIDVQITAAVSARMGRAWTNATSGNYCLVELTP